VVACREACVCRSSMHCSVRCSMLGSMRRSSWWFWGGDQGQGFAAAGGAKAVGGDVGGAVYQNSCACTKIVLFWYTALGAIAGHFLSPGLEAYPP
jgi:hypothetical protein